MLRPEAVHAMSPHIHHPPPPAGHARPEGELTRLRVVLVLTALFMGVEVVGGMWSGSLALLADAGHMLADVAAIALALLALGLARRPASWEKTYGYGRLEILAALV